MADKTRNSCILGRGVPLFLAGVLSCATVFASPQTVLTPGAHHFLMRVDEVVSHPRMAPTSLRWTLTGTEGAKLGGAIPGTSGPEFDAYPWLFNDPESGMPVLVWSRHNGLDYDLALTRFDGKGWSDPLLLVSTENDEIQPRAYAAPGEGFHLVWNWPGDQGSFLYGLFRIDSGIATVGPERLTVTAGRRGKDPFVQEGGLDDPGTGFDDCDLNVDNCRCQRTSGLCISGPPQEGASVCDSFSVVVGVGPRACVVTRTPTGWSTDACQSSQGGAGARELLQSLAKLGNTVCLP